MAPYRYPLVIALSCLAATWLAYLTWHTYFLGSYNNDDVAYFNIARSIANRVPYMGEGNQFPPGMPLVLAPVQGHGETSEFLSRLIMLAFGLASIPLSVRLGRLALGESEESKAPSPLWIALFMACNVNWVERAGWLMSDSFFGFLTLWLFLRLEEAKRDDRKEFWVWFGLGALGAYCYYVRIVGILLGAAVIPVLWKHWRRLFTFYLGFALCLPHLIHSISTDYGGQLASGGINRLYSIHSVGYNVEFYLKKGISFLVGYQHDISVTLAVAPACLLLYGVYRLLRKNSICSYWWLLNIAFSLAWRTFVPDARFMVPLIPISYICFLAAFESRPKFVPAAASGLLFLQGYCVIQAISSAPSLKERSEVWEWLNEQPPAVVASERPYPHTSHRIIPMIETGNVPDTVTEFSLLTQQQSFKVKYLIHMMRPDPRTDEILQHFLHRPWLYKPVHLDRNGGRMVLERTPTASFTRALVLEAAARSLITQKRYAEAEKILEKALKVFPRSFTARCALALTYLQQGKAEQARDLAASVLREDPNDSEAKSLFQQAQSRTEVYRPY